MKQPIYAKDGKELPDSALAKKWNGTRVVRNETNPWHDPGIDFSKDPGLTDQTQARDCDINTIVDRFTKTGVLPGVNRQAMFADVSDVPTYQMALDLVLRAEQQFMSLDAHVRKRFDNDPSKFLEFFNDPKNEDEARRLGLLDPPRQPAAAEAPAPAKSAEADAKK